MCVENVQRNLQIRWTVDYEICVQEGKTTETQLQYLEPGV